MDDYNYTTTIYQKGDDLAEALQLADCLENAGYERVSWATRNDNTIAVTYRRQLNTKRRRGADLATLNPTY